MSATQWIVENWETVAVVVGPLFAFLAWVGRVTLGVGRSTGEMVATLDALGQKVDTLRGDVRDDIEVIRRDVTILGADIRAERAARDRDVRELRAELKGGAAE